MPRAEILKLYGGRVTIVGSVFVRFDDRKLPADVLFAALEQWARREGEELSGLISICVKDSAVGRVRVYGSGTTK
jgi:hypothetical protein